MGIASPAADGIQSRLDARRQKELESQDRRGLSRESNHQLRLRTIHRELCTRLEVFCSVLEYYDGHGSELRRRDLSSARVRNFASPLWARAFLSAKTSLCQSGEGISSPQRLRESQSWSIACSRSVTDIFSISDDSIMSSHYHP